jgi:hypothetical protein
MMSMDVIHNDAKKGGKYGKVEGNIAPKINDYL